jgi:hypothetical protein
MSRGLGKVQREVLKVLRAEPDRVLPTAVVASAVYMNEAPRAEYQQQPLDIRMLVHAVSRRQNMELPQAARVAVSRACHALWRADLIEKYDMGMGMSGWRIAG